MTLLLFRDDPYRRDAPAQVTGYADDGALMLDASLFYPTGGGQPGDSGRLDWEGGSLTVQEAVKGEGGVVLLRVAADAPLPPVGARVHQHLDWERRLGHMRVHTALHLLSVVIPRPVTGGAIAIDRGRLDFVLPEPPEDPQAIEDALNALAARDLVVGQEWITEADLDANPGLVKTLSVQPPRGAGRIRLVRITDAATGETIDLQPCGGTHVARTAEIGPLRLGRIENKGKQNRRVPVLLATGTGG